eukprot:gene5234-biopygen197
MASIAGDGTASTSGDGGPATSAGISNFYGMWIDSVGNLYLPDNNALKFRKVNTSGIINTFVGSGNLNNTGTGGPALSISLDGAGCAWGDTAGNMYLTSSQYYIWFYNHTSGYVSRYAGTAGGNVGYSGDGGPATSAGIAQPLGLFLSTTGILYFADSGNNVIRAIDTKTTIITTFAGKQGASVLGDGGPATSAMMSPFGVWGNTAGVIFITDTNYNRIRKVVNGNITTIAGTGNANYNGDDIAATVADLYNPYNCQEDTLGNLYIADTINNRVRVVSAVTGNITTIAGNGLPWSSNGSLHVATAVGLSPSMIQLDTAGTIYFGDGGYVRLLFLATATPTATPSAVPSAFPTPTPSFVPSAIPSEMPTIVPSAIPN